VQEKKSLKEDFYLPLFSHISFYLALVKCNAFLNFLFRFCRKAGFMPLRRLAGRAIMPHYEAYCQL